MNAILDRLKNTLEANKHRKLFIISGKDAYGVHAAVQLFYKIIVPEEDREGVR